VGLGVLVFLAISVPVFGLKLGLEKLLRGSPIVDPIALLLFALVVGTLYYRTHRIVPSMAAHMALNATSVWILWLATGG
jgi:membrane protease YdiL (CAAX protease family)